MKPPIVYLHSALKQIHDFSGNSSLRCHQETKLPNSLALKFTSASYVGKLNKTLNCKKNINKTWEQKEMDFFFKIKIFRIQLTVALSFQKETIIGIQERVIKQ